MGINIKGALREISANKNISDQYDNTKTYSVGDLVIYGNTLFKCIVPVDTPEEFDSTKWEQTTIVDEVRFLIKNAIQEIIPRLGFKVLTVSELPASGEFGIIYLVSKEGGSNDEYDEYIWVIEEGEEVGKWEFLGSSSIDLTNYVTTNTEQTIKASKIFEGIFRVRRPEGTNSLFIEPDGNGYNAKIGFGTNRTLMFTTSHLYLYNHLIPNFNNLDLGSSSGRFRNLYLSGVLSDGTNSISPANIVKKPSTSYSLSNGATITDDTLKTLIQNEQPIKLNNFTCYFSCDDGTNYQYVSTRYDATANKNHINVIAINKSTWVATFHTSDIAIN